MTWQASSGRPYAAALGVSGRTWEMCSAKVHSDMMADWMRNLEPVVPPMLEAGLRVMVYAGEAGAYTCSLLSTT
jgi:hypothetical protein